MKKTKIIATIGPSSNSYEKIKEMIISGVDVFRINMSHSNHFYAEEIINVIRSVNSELNRNIGIFVDLKGPEVRIKINSKYINISKGENLIISNKEDAMISSTYPNFYRDLKIGDLLIFDDGSTRSKVVDIINEDIICECLNTGIIYNNKSVTAPHTKLSLKFLSERDIEDILFASRVGADFIGLSFVRTADDILDVNDLLITEKNEHVQLIAKIECNEAVNNIDSIVKMADGIMMARGSLALQIDLEKVPGVQKKFISKTREKNKICIIATEMLSSMEEKPTPTRAEVSDVANAVFDNVDAVTLSGETAIGKYPIETIQMMVKIIEEAEKSFNYDDLYRIKPEKPDITTVISRNVVSAANILDAKAIIVSTISGYTAKIISSFRPECVIFTTTPLLETATSLSLNWGIYPIVIEMLDNTDKIINSSLREAKKIFSFQSGDKVIITGGFPYKDVKYTNFLKIEEIE